MKKIILAMCLILFMSGCHRSPLQYGKIVNDNRPDKKGN